MKESLIGKFYREFKITEEMHKGGILEARKILMQQKNDKTTNSK